MPTLTEQIARKPLVTIRLGGEPFRCDCGCNVFRKRTETRYSCNACGCWYASDEEEPRAE